MQCGFDYTHEVPNKLWIFDLDDTLYPSNNGVWNAIGDRINQFIIENLNYPPETVHLFREDLFHKYGTTLRGLVVEHNIDPYSYLNYVHVVPIEEYIQPNPALADSLKQLAGEKIIFTNADKNHALRVLDRLELGGIFSRIVDVLDVWPHCKPMPEAFTRMIELSGNFNPTDSILVEDSLRNISTAKSMGFNTVLVSPTSVEDGLADAVLSSINDINSLRNRESWKEYWNG